MPKKSLQTALEAYLCEGFCASKTAKKLQTHVNRWLTHCGESRCSHIGREQFDQFRRNAAKNGLSPTTIETTITDICTLLRWLGHRPEVGRRLRRTVKCKPVPSITDIEQLYLACEVARWPKVTNPCHWWRSWLVIACWTGFRRWDLARLPWSSVKSDRIEQPAQKTGKTHSIPLQPFVRRHLDMMKAMNGVPEVWPRMPRSTSFKCLYRTLGEIALEAGVSDVTPQAFRRYAVTSWSSANAEAGRIVHGCGLGVMAHYIDQFRLLQQTATKVLVPDCWLTDLEREQRLSHEQLLLEAFRRANSADRDLLVQMAEKIG